MADQDRQLPKALELPGDMLGDFGHPITGQGLRIAARGLGRFGIPGPVCGTCLVTVVTEELDPCIPRLGMQPEPVDKDDRFFVGIIRWHAYAPEYAAN